MGVMTKGKAASIDEHFPPTLEPATWVLYDVWRRFKGIEWAFPSQSEWSAHVKYLLEALKMAFGGRAGGDGGSVITPTELLRRMQAITERADGQTEAAREEYMYKTHPGFLSTAAVFDRWGVFAAGAGAGTRPPRQGSHRPAVAAPAGAPSIAELEQALDTLARAQATLSILDLLRASPPRYLEACKPALVFEAVGALRWSLESVARTILSSLTGVRFFCVDALDWAAVPGGDCPSLEAVASYFDLPKPYIVLLARSEAVKAAETKGIKLATMRQEFANEPYVPILAALDPPLPPETADLLAAMNETVSAGMGHRISPSTASIGRHDARVAPAAEYDRLYPGLAPSPHPPVLNGALPYAPGMYSTMFRYSSQGNSVGARVVRGELQDQQAACAVALADRESQEIIMPHMRPAVALLAGRAAPSGVGLTVGGLAVGCKLVTLGGWGNEVHTDNTDAGGQAFIIMYARGDVGRLRGGWFLLPGCRLRTTPACPTLYYVASSLILHNTVSHTASPYARIVGTSLHMNRNLKIHFQAAVGTPEGNSATQGALEMLRYGREEAISQETKDKYPVVRQTLKKVAKKKAAWHGERWE